MTQPRRSNDYLPQLDAIRALAIFAVMVHHWAEPLARWMPWGELGVRCFFVLSGFLITGILLRSRGLVESGKTGVGWQFRQFYIRRSLRIFPIYFLTLGVGCWLGMEVLRKTLGWHAGYLSNFYFAKRGAWHGYVSHLWSLSVEEQFYLLWPAVVLLLPRRGLRAAIIAGIVLGPVSRILCVAVSGPDSLAARVLTPCSFDSLLGGALLAWFAERRGGIAGLPAAGLRLLGVCGAVGTSVMLAFRNLSIAPHFEAVVSPLAETAFFVAVVAGCARGVRGIAGRVLDNGFLQYTGRISYGLYLYHMFAPYVGGMLAQKLGFKFPAGPGVLQFMLLFAMSYAAAAFSARFIEGPINSLKRHFPAGPRREAELPAAHTCGSLLPEIAKLQVSPAPHSPNFARLHAFAGEASGNHENSLSPVNSSGEGTRVVDWSTSPPRPSTS